MKRIIYGCILGVTVCIQTTRADGALGGYINTLAVSGGIIYAGTSSRSSL
jgi:hypothetical protein